MRKTFFILTLVLVSIFCQPFTATAQGSRPGSQRKLPSRYDVPEPENKYVNDFATILRSADIMDLQMLLEQVDQQTGIEISLVTVENASNYGAGSNVDALALDFFNTWGVGNVDKNDGVLILVSPGDRKMRIEPGDGYGTQIKSDLQHIIESEFVPEFARDNYPQGIINGTTAVVKLLTREKTFKDYFTPEVIGMFLLFLFLVGVAISCFKNGKSGWGWAFLVAAGVVLVFLFKMMLANRSRRYGGGSFGGGFSSGGGGASGSW